ncbi:beta-ketoacyl synthase N-terminal-like domain-containing protein [Gracilibacillus sp. JCM 18860]|uniref:beta-ketoacyl synthase N-terminal-like domain-containing protein n=1 Tax=Gracilibacillus sp. JCM 18860 TaxID=1306159 RepID=UPI003260A02C
MEHDNIAALANYLMEQHGTAFQKASATKRDKKVKTSPKVTVRDGQMQQKEDIAIVGIASRFPDAPTKEAYWQLLKQGKSALRSVPKTRWMAKNGRVDKGGGGLRVLTDLILTFSILIGRMLRLWIHRHACFWKKALKRFMMQVMNKVIYKENR